MTEVPSQRRNSRVARFVLVGALVCALLPVGASIAYAHTIYAPNQAIVLGDFVYDDDYVATTTDCSISVWAPYGTLIVNSTTMTADANGWHHYEFSSSTQGTWPASMSCGSNLNGSLIKEDLTFVIATSSAPTANDISAVVSADVNANTNTQVNNASTSLFALLPNSIWTFSGRTLTSFGTLVADIWTSGARTLTSGSEIAADIWAATTRTLTGAGLTSGSLATLSDIQTATSSLGSAITASQDAITTNTNSALVTATSSLAAVVNTNTNAQILNASTSLGSSLTSLATSVTEIPAAVWAAGTRTLTGFGTLAADVWSNGTRTLTGADLSSGSLATLSDVQSASSSVVTLVNTNTNSAVTTATSSLAAVINANTNTSVTGASSSLGSLIGNASTSLSAQILNIPALVWANGTRSLTTFGTLAADVWNSTTRTLTGADLSSGSLATLSDVMTATSSLASAISAGTTNIEASVGNASTSLAAAIAGKATLTNQQAGWTVSMSDFGSLLAGTTYRTRVTVLNYQSQPTDPASAPSMTLYDADRNVVASGVSMTHTATGIYDYTYTVSSSAAEGTWESSVATQVESGKTITTTDYWNVTSAPAQVLIQSMDSTATPAIGANVRITNEGSVDYEYHYEWCVVTAVDNQCGGGNDTYYASASKLIHPGENFDTVLTATVPTEGQYYFKTLVYFGNQVSGATRQFDTAGYAATTGGGGGASTSGGGGGGGGGSSAPKPSDGGAGDVNGDGKVSAVDFSILLAFWKASPPFKNPTVDLNHDGKVNAVDFSILLYNWGSH